MEDFNKKNIPLVSVIVPIYNDSKFLKKCLDSIDAQTYAKIEIILVNDGSTDNSQQICKEFKDSSLRDVTVINQKNQGSSVARNKGLDIAKGQYISFSDGDDWLLPEMIEKLVNVLEDNNLKIAECGHTNTSSKTVEKQENKFIKETREQAFERIVRNKIHAVWKRMYSKDLIADFKFNIGKLHQDHHFTLEMISRIEYLGLLTEDLYVYNTSSEQSIVRSNFNQKKIDSMDQILYLNGYRKYFNKNTQILATSNILNRMKFCYHELYNNPKLDPDFTHRKQIKTWIQENYNTKHIKHSSYTLIANCPVKFYKFLYKFKTFIN